MDSNDLGSFNRVAGFSSIFGGAVALFQLLRGLGQYVPTWAPLTTTERLNVLLHISILTVIAHGILWKLFEWLFHWNYGPGPVTPKGIAALVLSLSLTLPAVIVPVFYQAATSTAVVSSGHFRGAILSLAGGAIAYVILFGTDDIVFPGVRGILLERLQHRPLIAELMATLAYSIVLIGLIAMPYRMVVAPQSPAQVFVGRPILASLVVFLGTTGYILLMYPDSIRTVTWIHTRGIIAGLFTALSVCIALYT